MPNRKVPNDETLTELYLEKRLPSGDIGQMFGCTRNTICRHLKRLGIVRPQSGPNSRNRNFKTKQYRSGYPVTFLPDHHRSNNIGYVFDHILLMEKHLGRDIGKDERIHHINCDRADCRVDNLWLSDGSRHRKAHTSVNLLIKHLLELGMIRFDRERGIYELVWFQEK